MRKTMTVILAIALVFLMMNGAPAKTYVSPFDLLGKFIEDCIYIMDPEVTLTVTMVQEGDPEEDYDAPLELTATALCHGRPCEVKIAGNRDGATEITLRAQPEQLRMGDDGRFPEELSIYHKLHYVICSQFPVFNAIYDGYGIELLLAESDDAGYDTMQYYDEQWTWISREPMHFSLSIYSEKTEFRFGAEAQEDGTVLITWTVSD